MEFALVALTLPEAGVVTEDVVIGKFAAVDPGGSVTVAGTVTLGTVLESPTATPPAAAGLARVTVPIAGWPPVIVEGVMLSDATVPVPSAAVFAGGLIVTGVLTEFALVAVTLPEAGAVTEDVVIGKFAAVDP